MNYASVLLLIISVAYSADDIPKREAENIYPVMNMLEIIGKAEKYKQHELPSHNGVSLVSIIYEYKVEKKTGKYNGTWRVTYKPNIQGTLGGEIWMYFSDADNSFLPSVEFGR